MQIYALHSVLRLYYEIKKKGLTLMVCFGHILKICLKNRERKKFSVWGITNQRSVSVNVS